MTRKGLPRALRDVVRVEPRAQRWKVLDVDAREGWVGGGSHAEIKSLPHVAVKRTRRAWCCETVTSEQGVGR